MSTRCRIGMMQDDGTIKSIYCHHDGYPEGVGRILNEHYQDPQKIEELLELGDISCLGEQYDEGISKADWHKFGLPQKEFEKHCQKRKGYTIAYKDRGEHTTAEVDTGWYSFIDALVEDGIDYVYVYEPDYTGAYEWRAVETPHPKSLTEVLGGDYE